MNRETFVTEINRRVELLREELVASTSRILQFESISGSEQEADRIRHETATHECAEFLKSLSTQMGFRWIEKPGRWYCIEWTPEKAKSESLPVLAIPVHIDVVPVGGKWTHPPFSGAIADESIWGRGAVDMKGPLMSCLYALHALHTSGWDPPVVYRIIIGTREEINDWSDIEEYLSQEGTPDYGFTPDACFPVVTGEKGSLMLRVAATWKPEAPSHTDPIPLRLEGGTRGNVVPDRCELRLQLPSHGGEGSRTRIYEAIDTFRNVHPSIEVECEPVEGKEPILRCVFHGKSAHGSTPEKGRNAVLDGLAFLLSLETEPDLLIHVARFLHQAGSDLEGGRLGIASSHEFIGSTTVNLGIARLETGRLDTVFNIRPTLGLSTEQARRRVEGTIRSLPFANRVQWRFEKQHTAFEPQCLNPKAMHPFLSGLQEGFTAATGLPAPFVSIPYTTYAKAMPGCCAFGPILHSAGEQDVAHQPDERVGIEALVRNTRIYALSLAFSGMNVASS